MKASAPRPAANRANVSGSGTGDRLIPTTMSSKSASTGRPSLKPSTKAYRPPAVYGVNVPVARAAPPPGLNPLMTGMLVPSVKLNCALAPKAAPAMATERRSFFIESVLVVSTGRDQRDLTSRCADRPRAVVGDGAGNQSAQT